MNKNELTDFLTQHTEPVILLEGRRDIPESYQERATQLGQWLAETFPHAKFRSGNATGSDECFSQGVMSVNPERLEVFAPTARHRSRERQDAVTYLNPSELTEEEEQVLAELTNRATPKNATLIDKRHSYPRLKAKANYLIRDTLKVVGSESLGFGRPALALFYVHPEDPMAGGTGHTIRVCQQEDIPTLTQEHWHSWLNQ